MAAPPAVPYRTRSLVPRQLERARTARRRLRLPRPQALPLQVSPAVTARAVVPTVRVAPVGLGGILETRALGLAAQARLGLRPIHRRHRRPARRGRFLAARLGTSCAA